MDIMLLSRIVSLLTLSLLPLVCHADLRLITQDKPPFNYLDTSTGQVIGLSIDILRDASSRAKVAVSNIGLYPMVRSVDMARKQADTCVFPMIRTKERENLFKWVGPYTRNVWVFYARDDFKTPISSLEEAKKFRFGSDIHSAKTSYLASMGFNAMDLLPEDAANAKRLAAGRFDLWLVGLYEGKVFADVNHIKNIRPVFEVKTVDYYLACNLSVPTGSIAALNDALKNMKVDGSMQRMIDSNHFLVKK